MGHVERGTTARFGLSHGRDLKFRSGDLESENCEGQNVILSFAYSVHTDIWLILII